MGDAGWAPKLEALAARIADLDEQIAERKRAGDDNPAIQHSKRAATTGDDWAARAANAIRAMGGESRAVVAGSVDIPSLVRTDVVTKARPERLLDLIVDRESITTNAFAFYRQTVRTNNAAPVADSATKPTSVFTYAEMDGRARVIAHLSEPVPLRLLADHAELERFLSSELVDGVLDALEYQIVSGPGTGETFTGILSTSGTTAVAYDTSLVKTLRSALTTAQIAGEKPTAWVVHPSDAATLDLLLETSGNGFLIDGFQTGNSRSGNVFGADLPRVVSPSIPAGTALLADFSQLRLFVREDVRVDVDLSGPELFDKNQAKFRGEGRFGLGVLRPSSFFVIDLTP